MFKKTKLLRFCLCLSLILMSIIPFFMLSTAGAVKTSQGVAIINADAWHADGYTGNGMKVGILDGGFTFYDTEGSLGELPASGSIGMWWAPSWGDEGIVDHGTGCAEIIYDIAFGAQFYLANYYTEDEFCDAADWLISQGVDVISCSAGNVLWGPGNGSGTVCDKIEDVRNAGILWVQCAGNERQRHWSGPYQDGDGDDWHDFSPGDERNTVHLDAGDGITVYLKWNDPWGGSGNDYDLHLYNPSGVIVKSSENWQLGAADDYPTEELTYTATVSGNYGIAIEKSVLASAVSFHLYISGNYNLEYKQASGSLVIPADSAHALTVGAVPFDSIKSLDSGSSLGPTDDARIKPDVVAPTGVETGLSSSFGGTSASTPHVAGAALLVKQRFRNYTPDQIQAYLEKYAVDLGAPGKDNMFGSGRLNLPTYKYCTNFDEQRSWVDDAYIYVDGPNSRLYWYTDSNYRSACDSSISATTETEVGDVIEFEYRYIDHYDGSTRQNVLFGFTDSMPTENVWPANFIGGLAQNCWSDFQTHVFIYKDGSRLFDWGENDHTRGTPALYKARIEIIKKSTYAVTVWKDNAVVYPRTERSGNLTGMNFPYCAAWNAKTQSLSMGGWYKGQLNYIWWTKQEGVRVLPSVLHLLLGN